MDELQLERVRYETVATRMKQGRANEAEYYAAYKKLMEIENKYRSPGDSIEIPLKSKYRPI